MWRSKKFIVIALVAGVLIIGGISGVALAADNVDDNQPKARYGAMLDKVCEIYNANPDRPGDVDCDILKAAFDEARQSMQTEAMQNHLQNLINEGKITQEQVDALKEWRDARPDAPNIFGFKGRGGFHGMGGPCAPAE